MAKKQHEIIFKLYQETNFSPFLSILQMIEFHITNIIPINENNVNIICVQGTFYVELLFDSLRVEALSLKHRCCNWVIL